MFKMAVRNHWVERNPAADFELVDADGEERSRERWLRIDELRQPRRRDANHAQLRPRERAGGVAVAADRKLTSKWA
jgi:hypothetical protein